MSDVLNVYLLSDLVGRLWLDDRRSFSFQYDQAWLLSEHPVPLSISLPLRTEVYADDESRPFFANLLPESELRKIITRRLGISQGNDFALLEAIGGECAGAVTLVPEGDQLSVTVEYQQLSDEELNSLIRDLPKRPMMVGEAGVRLSLAGVQNKLPVFYDENEHRVCLPKGSAASSHILKPSITHYESTVENEYFCMLLARNMGLIVPDVMILHEEERLYLVRRYDRVLNSEGVVTRLHQEDFCQALAIAPDMKYEKEGGPSLKNCFNLVREISMTPIVDVKAMLGWVIFNYLIGNADAHGKNISLLFKDDGPVLAPCYDLMSTVVYPELTDKMAMKIGGEYRPQWLMKRHWEQFAEDINVGYKIIHQTLLEMSESIVNESVSLKQHFFKQNGECEVINRINKVIDERAGKIIARLNDDESM